MNLVNHYWYFQKALSEKFCDEIIKYAKSNEEKIALTGKFNDKEDLTKSEIKELKKKRNSNVVWLDDKWIYRQILPYVDLANKNAGWNFEFDYSEPCQFTKYSVGQYYGWHCDSWETPYDRPNNKNIHGKIRKLSVTCSLSEPSDYIGGELEFNFNDPEKSKNQNIRKCLEILPRGSIVVFPSFVQHRVCPVKNGTRYSLVIWNLGYPYK
jgi:PKHD-type hydroxylase